MSAGRTLTLPARRNLVRVVRDVPGAVTGGPATDAAIGVSPPRYRQALQSDRSTGRVGDLLDRPARITVTGHPHDIVANSRG
jgi:hypothetical protein